VPVRASTIARLKPSPVIERPHCLSMKARPASSENSLGTVVPNRITGSVLASSMHGRSLYDHFRRTTFPSLNSGGEGIVPGRYCGST
jgi:hypothetical protein